MRRSLFVALSLFVAACGTSPQQACKDIVAATCNKMFTCYTGAELDAIKTFFGSSESECVTKLNAQSSCDKEQPCDSPKTYDATAASKCVSDYKAMSCADLKSSTGGPSSCETVCK